MMPLNHLLPKKLKKRIIVLFFIFTLFFSVLISLGFITLAKHAEKQLQVIDMGLAIERIRKQYLNGENVGRTNRFFHGQKHSTEFPEWVRDLPAGFYKIRRDHLVWHVMIADYPDQRYILLRDYTVFESSRLHPVWLLLMILISSLLLSLILVWITLYFVIHPIEKLQRKIREELTSTNKHQLSEGYGENEIGQLAQAFDQVYDKLNQALQRERLFTADVSHELRTPLMVISTSTELLLVNPRLDTKTEQRLNNIQQAAQNILQRLEVYLALARQNTSPQDNFIQQPLQEIAQTVIQENMEIAARFQVKLLLSDQTNGISMRYPIDFCYTVLSNLIKNALEYAGSGSTVQLILMNDGFSVIDDGVGIATDFQAFILEEFTGTQSSSSQHLGLGLSLVQRICHDLNWELEFSSQPGQCTSFRVYTPSRNLKNI